MRLDPEERAVLMRLLVETLDAESDEGVEDVWRLEIERRMAELDSVQTVPWEELRARLYQRSMAPAAVRFHPAAAQGAEEAYDWYAARNPAAAQGFREELRRAVETVAGSPGTWPRYRSLARQRFTFSRRPGVKP